MRRERGRREEGEAGGTISSRVLLMEMAALALSAPLHTPPCTPSPAHDEVVEPFVTMLMSV